MIYISTINELLRYSTKDDLMVHSKAMEECVKGCGDYLYTNINETASERELRDSLKDYLDYCKQAMVDKSLLNELFDLLYKLKTNEQLSDFRRVLHAHTKILKRKYDYEFNLDRVERALITVDETLEQLLEDINGWLNKS